MRQPWLPLSGADGRRIGLPLSGSSAVAICEAWLRAEGAAGDAAQAALGGALRSDPALLLWCVATSLGADDREVPGADSYAPWLATKAAEQLLAEVPAENGLCSAAPDLAAFVPLCKASLQIGQIAAAVALASDPDAAESARLLGLLHNALDWLSAAGEQRGGTPQAAAGPKWPGSIVAEGSLAVVPLPPWLARRLAALGAESAEAASEAATAAVRRALRIRSRLEKPPRTVALRTLQRQASQQAKAWAAAPGAAGLLPLVAAHLTRHRALQVRFQEQLEQQKLEALAEFSAGAGHEINNPIAVISGRAQLLLRDEPHPQRRSELALIAAQATRVYEMIANLMLFARPPAPRIEAVDITSLVDEAVAELQPAARQRRIRVFRSDSAPPTTISADREQLLVALRAICDNALQVLGEDGTIEVRLELPADASGGAGPDQVRILIRDDGPGIAPEVRRHLFDPFFSGRSAGRGLGLGLSKAWRIVSNHGGQIDIDSQTGHGATFIVRLPKRTKA